MTTFVAVAQEAGGKSVLCEAQDVIGIEIQRLLHAQKIFADVTAELGGIVGIHRCAESGVQQPLEVVILERIEYAQFDIG